jgi:hypothetical protein
MREHCFVAGTILPIFNPNPGEAMLGTELSWSPAIADGRFPRRGASCISSPGARIRFS